MIVDGYIDEFPRSSSAARRVVDVKVGPREFHVQYTSSSWKLFWSLEARDLSSFPLVMGSVFKLS